MGILSERAIKRHLEDGTLKIDPPPEPADFDTDSIEIHLGDTIYEWSPQPAAVRMTISLWQTDSEKFVYNRLAEAHLKTVPPDNAGVITLRPRSFYLADLRQHTTLPHDVAMHIQGKSSLARLGMLVHLTAPHAHAGWTGRLTLEICNLGPFNIELKPGMPIGQLTFWRLEDPDTEAVQDGQFSNQQDARGNPQQ